jgi:predicted phosphodiesterase
LKVAIISDLHSNVEATQKAAEVIKGLGVDRIYCLGDIVGYGPNPIEIIHWVQENVHRCVMGNHDEAVLKEPKYFNRIPYEAVMWTKTQLSLHCEAELAYLRNLEPIISDEGMVFTHGLLDNNMRYVDNTDDLMNIFEMMADDEFICFGGHSHFPTFWTLTEDGLTCVDLEPGDVYTIPESVQKIWVNVGSIGQPRDGDPRLSFVTYDSESKQLVHHRHEYDFQGTMGKIRKVPELDNFLAERLEKGI